MSAVTTSSAPPASQPSADEVTDEWTSTEQGKEGLLGRLQALKEDLSTKPWRDTLYAAIFCFGAVCFMTWVLNFVHYRMPDPRYNQPLPDIIHDLVPPQKKTIASEVLYHGVTVVTVLSGMWHYRLSIFPFATRFILTWAFSWYLRIIVIMATSLPPTEDHFCRSDYENYETDFPHPIPSFFWNTVVGVVTLGNGNVHCGDLLFSGHTTLITVDWMFMLTYMRHNGFLVLFTTCCTLVKAFLIVAERHHYTIDVLCSIYVSATIWYMTPEHLPNWMVWPFRSLRRLAKKALCCCRREGLEESEMQLDMSNVSTITV